MTPRPAPRPLDPVRTMPRAERAWLTTELRDFAHHVRGSLAPRGYEAYVRIPHALESEDPEEGCLADGQLAALLPVLAAHTTTPDDCWFGLWDGFGFLHKGGVSLHVIADTPQEEAAARAEITANWPGLDVSRMPLLHLPERDYLLFRGTVHDADRVGVGIGPYANEMREGPNLAWPADRSWFLATEIDLTSTYLACTRALADTLLTTPTLEALLLPPHAPVL